MELGITYDPAYDSPPADPNVDASGFSASLEQIAPNVTTMITQQQQPGQTWFDSLTSLLPIIVATDQQRQLLQVQVDRAKQGLPPLDVSQYGAGVQVGVSSNLQKLITYGGIGLLAVLALHAVRR